MNKKKFWISFVALFVILEILNLLIHNVILGSTYSQPEVSKIFRSMEDMQSKMWIFWVSDLVWTYFFTLLFVKGYENKGITEGLRFGAYIGLFTGIPMAYASYALYPLPYSLAFQWFIYTFISCLILGAVITFTYKNE